MTDATTSLSFAGEEFLTERLPNYETERIYLIFQLVLAFAFWIIVLPLFMSQEVVLDNNNNGSNVENNVKNNTNNNNSNTNDNASSKSTKSKNQQQLPAAKSSSSRGKKGKDSKKSTTAATVATTTTTTTSSNPPQETIRELNPIASAFCCIGCMASLVWIMLKVSPDNYYTTRGVFEAPLFTRDECNHVIEMAEQAAHRNYLMAQQHAAEAAMTETLALKTTTTETTETTTTETTSTSASASTKLGIKHLNSTLQGFLQEPIGWQKKRHSSYPTTDLNIVTDPFTVEDRVWLKQKLDARLAPTMSRLFGIPPGAIRAEDIFVIRYDGDRQASLNRHTDSGDITFSALLSDGFEGGGTRYWNRNTHEPFVYLLPEIGQTTIFPAVINHEGVQVTNGRRYLLIGFLSVDKYDPFTMESTGLSWFASWGSLNWATVRFKAGYESARRNIGKGVQKWTNHKHVRGFFMHMLEILYATGDATMPHYFKTIVAPNRTHDFLKALDDAYYNSHNKNDDDDKNKNKNGNEGNKNNLPGKEKKNSKLQNQRQASWFQGQLINVDIDGTVNFVQANRRNNKDIFEQDNF